MNRQQLVEEFHSDTLRLMLELAQLERDVAIARAQKAEAENRRLRTQLRTIRQSICCWLDKKAATLYSLN